MSETIATTVLAKVIHLGTEAIDSLSAASDVIEALGRTNHREVVINRGARDGLKLGDRYLVFGLGPEVADPDTKEKLGRIELVRGRGEIVHVQDRIAVIRSIERGRTGPIKRFVREAPDGFGVFRRDNRLVEEELPPEVDLPFEGVRLGDLAKPV